MDYQVGSSFYPMMGKLGTQVGSVHFLMPRRSSSPEDRLIRTSRSFQIEFGLVCSFVYCLFIKCSEILSNCQCKIILLKTQNRSSASTEGWGILDEGSVGASNICGERKNLRKRVSSYFQGSKNLFGPNLRLGQWFTWS